jgi:hypothetical protein
VSLATSLPEFSSYTEIEVGSATASSCNFGSIATASFFSEIDHGNVLTELEARFQILMPPAPVTPAT